jgi:hypothetical protein
VFGFGTSTISSADGRFEVGGDIRPNFECDEVADDCESWRVGSFERTDEALATAVSSVGDLYFRLAMLHVSTSCQLSLPTFRCLTYSEANVVQKSGLSRRFHSHLRDLLCVTLPLLVPNAFSSRVSPDPVFEERAKPCNLRLGM